MLTYKNFNKRTCKNCSQQFQPIYKNQLNCSLSCVRESSKTLNKIAGQKRVDTISDDYCINQLKNRGIDITVENIEFVRKSIKEKRKRGLHGARTPRIKLTQCSAQ